MSTPTTTNQAATIVDTIIKDLNTAGVKVVETLVIADYPFLGWPIVKQCFEFGLSFLDSYIAQAEEQGATFGVIDVQVGSEKIGLSTALAALIAAEKSGDQNAIQNAIKNYQAAQSNLVNDDGSAST